MSIKGSYDFGSKLCGHSLLIYPYHCCVAYISDSSLLHLNTSHYFKTHS